MSRRCKDTLYKGVLSRCYLRPISKRVALQVSMEVQQIIPAVRYAVDDDYLCSRLLAYTYSLDICFGSVVVKSENLIGAKMSI